MAYIEYSLPNPMPPMRACLKLISKDNLRSVFLEKLQGIFEINMMNSFVCLMLLFVSSNANAQDTLTLQQCIDVSKKNEMMYATENRTLSQADLNIKYNKWSLLPSLTGSTSFNTSFGRRVDPFTNTFATNTVNSQSFGLSTSIPVFNGFNYIYTRNKLEIEKQKNELSLKQKLNANSIKIIELYVELCTVQLQKDLAVTRIEKYKQIQVIQKSLLKGGKINSIDTLKSFNSLLTEESNLLNLENQIEQKSIDLNYIVGLPLTSKFAYQFQSIKACKEEIEFSESFDLENLDIEMNALQEQLGIDRSRILPSLSISGSFGTGYSTNNKDYTVPGNPTLPYNEQINKNLYEGIGVNLSIPIFNKGTYLKARQLSELSKTELEQRKELKTLEIEKRKLQNEQQLSYLNSEINQLKTVTNNLQLIYDKTFLIYKEGKITYREVETAFLEWQVKLIEMKVKELDLEVLKLYYK
jgi:outer membrane protein